MRTFALAGVIAATALLSTACSSDTDKKGEGAASEPEACSYDSPKKLLPALKGGFGDEATVHMDMKMSGGGADMTMTGDMRMSDSGSEMDIRSTGASEFAMIVVDDRFFIAEKANNPRYTEIPADDPSAALMKQQLASADIRTTFDAFDSGLKGVKSVGREEVDGDPVCHYELTVDTAKALQAQGQKTTPAGMPKTLDYELYLDDEDHMRRVTFEMGPLEMVMDMTKWNEPVDIKAPKVG